jgi:hypothetical protein
MEINAALLHVEAADVILDSVAPCTGLIWIVSLFLTVLHENHSRSISMICLVVDAERVRQDEYALRPSSQNHSFHSSLDLLQSMFNWLCNNEGNWDVDTDIMQ